MITQDSTQSATVSKNQTILENKISKFREHIGDQQQLIDKIETKVQRLFRAPVDPEKEDSMPEAPDVDFVTSFGKELTFIDRNNQRLRNIVSNLTEVI